ncbi:MAG: ADP-glyceromanno-heptose 6-epimerase [Chitinophagales bacterium]|nr:ADP-glyceromanno-heptose 6-epimerase [Chitinophagales bacterium]
MIIITGAAGFIGSCLVAKLNEEGNYHLGLVDDFSSDKKKRNYELKRYLNTIERNEFIDWLDLQHDSIDFIFHLGARTDTTEANKELLDDLNLNYSKDIWQRCTKYGIPLIYASSAATYGGGEFGYDDQLDLIPLLKPLNEYGISKNEFDKWVLQQTETPPFWCGLKFFNVYGPNEYHKSRMASVVFHGFNQIRENGNIRLFKSHRQDFKDGEQRRDFIYVKDVTEVLMFFFHHQKDSGIYNLGTGLARTFLDLANSTFQAMSLTPTIEWIEIPADIRDKYQYFTEANMQKLRSIGYSKPFYSLEEGIRDYVQQYLLHNKIW